MTMDTLLRFARARHGKTVALRWLLSLFMALSFVSLATAAETHTHKPAQVVHDCMLCGAAADQIGDTPVPPALVRHALVQQSYAVSVELALPSLPPSAALLPPSCGPPSTPV